MDFLEKQILAQREELDQIERVDEGLLWQNIQADLNPQKEEKTARRFSLLQMYAVAASVALLMMAAWIFTQKENSARSVIAEVEKYEPDFEEKESYLQTVSQKEKELKFDQIDRTEYQDIFYELEVLEEIHKEFKSDLPTISDQEMKIEILQKYYERKIRILEQLSREIEKKSHNEKRINERPM